MVGGFFTSQFTMRTRVNVSIDKKSDYGHSMPHGRGRSTAAATYAMVVSAFSGHGEVLDFLRELSAQCDAAVPPHSCSHVLRKGFRAYIYAHCYHKSHCLRLRQDLAFCSSSSALPCRVTFIPNVGREASAFLHHLLHVYAEPDLEDVTLFLQEHEFAGMLPNAQAMAGLPFVEGMLTGFVRPQEDLNVGCNTTRAKIWRSICKHRPHGMRAEKFQRPEAYYFTSGLHTTLHGAGTTSDRCGNTYAANEDALVSCSMGKYMAPHVRFVLERVGIACPPMRAYIASSRGAMAVHRCLPTHAASRSRTPLAPSFATPIT